jgi:hypothetical protein
VPTVNRIISFSAYSNRAYESGCGGPSAGHEGPTRAVHVRAGQEHATNTIQE